jgi:ankyrin
MNRKPLTLLTALLLTTGACDTPKPQYPQPFSSSPMEQGIKPSTNSLTDAVREGSLTTVQGLLARGADPNALDSQGQAALHAFFSGRNWRLEPAVLDQLLARGAKPDLPDREGRTALHAAAERGRPEMVQRLLRAGAKLDRKDAKGQTALHRAAETTHKKTLAILLAAMADPNAADEQGRTPLHLAVEQGSWPVVFELLWAGADPDREDDWGQRPIAWVAKRCVQDLQTRLTASEHLKTPACSRLPKLMEAALHQAAADGRLAVVEHLLQKGIKHKKAFGFHPLLGSPGSALHAAAAAGHPAVIDRLLDAGAKIEARDRNGWTPLHLAVWKDRPTAVSGLIRRGADPHAKTRSGQSARDLAAQKSPALTEALKSPKAQ